ncbi:hypothetical protein [Leptospira kirschneri]|nr:hypothetical protein [Leptospira kirschneri]EMO75377.1 hypothetical protein LEP1GSC127_1330 [Leptospira kirschneri str. 200801925]EJO70046.1 hypothetical protein LEP1GSC044_0744 [Leptospira kirschneri serovar Grippotyphosa str. RM52]EKQ83178.1 hypothetical protein LEP1GSC064_1182 [Leptospira kirschneri serovar Grippotyphosa str. Moskva]EKR07880.1 hypothetical protein LEP1GSC122_2235 [Leptospira kirschneri serovar Valbuzzi str. 200702274]EMK00764.1 hypothetical protein LEP1GSC176_0799 [Lepto
MNKVFFIIFLGTVLVFTDCRKEVPTSSPLRKINLQTFLNSSETKKFSVELAHGKIGVNVFNIPKLPKKIHLVLRNDDCVYYVVRGNLQLTLSGAEPIMLQSEEVLFIPSGIVHSISSDKVNSKVLMIKSSNTSEVEYLQESEITLQL